MICTICNRPLKSKKSIEKGIGPVCAKKQQESKDQMELELQVNK